MSKLDVLRAGDWEACGYSNTYRFGQTRGPARLTIAPASGHVDLMIALAVVLRPPFAVLYVPHTPRGEALAGRYQSGPLQLAEVRNFLFAHGPFIAADSRHDLWIRSQPDTATLVWDRHDLVYAYGPLERFEDVLMRHGFCRGEVAVPSPHRHHYHAEWDSAERLVLGQFDWTYSPLRSEDEQA